MKHKALKITAGVVAILVAALIFFDLQFHAATQFTWGIDFSPDYARSLGFNARIMYLDILTDLKPKKIRIGADWDDIEPNPGQYNFAEMDDLLNLAQQYHVQVILGVGKKLPRWPECHEPGWVDQLAPAAQEQAEMDMIKTVVNHFKTFPAVTIWQVENEPEFAFGQGCPVIPLSQLKVEIALVKSLDTRPVLVTDSGELGLWLPAASAGGDLFGSSMYRVVYNHVVQYWRYPIPPIFYHIKAGILETFYHPKQIIGVELQAEPWLTNGVAGTDLTTQRTLMNPKIFEQNVEYAEQAGFSDNYLWGVEWWYWMAKTQNDWGMWTAAKKLLNP